MGRRRDRRRERRRNRRQRRGPRGRRAQGNAIQSLRTGVASNASEIEQLETTLSTQSAFLAENAELDAQQASQIAQNERAVDAVAEDLSDTADLVAGIYRSAGLASKSAGKIAKATSRALASHAEFFTSSPVASKLYSMYTKAARDGRISESETRNLAVRGAHMSLAAFAALSDSVGKAFARLDGLAVTVQAGLAGHGEILAEHESDIVDIETVLEKNGFVPTGDWKEDFKNGIVSLDEDGNKILRYGDALNVVNAINAASFYKYNAGPTILGGFTGDDADPHMFTEVKYYADPADLPDPKTLEGTPFIITMSFSESSSPGLANHGATTELVAAGNTSTPPSGVYQAYGYDTVTGGTVVVNGTGSYNNTGANPVLMTYFTADTVDVVTSVTPALAAVEYDAKMYEMMKAAPSGGEGGIVLITYHTIVAAHNLTDMGRVIGGEFAGTFRSVLGRFVQMGNDTIANQLGFGKKLDFGVAAGGARSQGLLGLLGLGSAQ